MKVIEVDQLGGTKRSTVPTFEMNNVGTVPTLCILNIRTVPKFSPSELVHLNDLHYLSLEAGPPE